MCKDPGDKKRLVLDGKKEEEKKDIYYFVFFILNVLTAKTKFRHFFFNVIFFLYGNLSEKQIAIFFLVSDKITWDVHRSKIINLVTKHSYLSIC